MLRTKLVQRRSGFDHSGVICRQTKDSQNNVVKSSTKHGRNAFNVNSPASVILMGSIQKISNNFEAHWLRYWDASDVVSNDETWDQEPRKEHISMNGM